MTSGAGTEQGHLMGNTFRSSNNQELLHSYADLYLSRGE